MKKLFAVLLVFIMMLGTIVSPKAYVGTKPEIRVERGLGTVAIYKVWEENGIKHGDVTVFITKECGFNETLEGCKSFEEVKKIMEVCEMYDDIVDDYDMELVCENNKIDVVMTWTNVNEVSHIKVLNYVK